ncbi:MAG: hypothetical protein ACR2NR_15980 [Solirubrobacteraceae bacterium]
MLFDLRSRGRRRTVQVVYLGLAILFGAGLVLFGVGTGSGGGLLNAFTGNGSGNSQSSAVSQAEKTALRQTKANPSSPAAWAALVNARWSTANQNSQQTTTGFLFNTKGKQELAGTTDAWQQYQKLTKAPNPDLAILAARAYAYQTQYAQSAATWQVEAKASPNEAKGYVCLALTAYAANQTRVGDLAKAKALSLSAKSIRKTLSSELDQAKTTPSVAQNC